MLLLHLYIRDDDDSQELARSVHGGFLFESWMALLRSGQVYDARITALKHPELDHFSSILLSTTYDGAPNTYHQFFYEKLGFFFISLALVAKKPPFTFANLTPKQQAAFIACKDALKKCQGATSPGAFVEAMGAFSASLPVFSAAMAEDDNLKRQRVIAETKFELFSKFVNENDLLYSVGSPPEPGASATHDLRVPPPITGRSNFLNPALPEGPFPLTLPGK